MFKSLKKRKTSCLLPKIQQWPHFFKNLKRCREDDGLVFTQSSKNYKTRSKSPFNGTLITVLKNLLFPKVYLSYSE